MYLGRPEALFWSSWTRLVLSASGFIMVIVLFLCFDMTCLDAGTACIALVVHLNRLLWYDPGSFIDQSLCTTRVSAMLLFYTTDMVLILLVF